MKRITVSLPDDLVDELKKAAGGEGKVSAYVAEALRFHVRRESLDDLLDEWEREAPVPPEVAAWADAEIARVQAEWDAIDRQEGLR